MATNNEISVKLIDPSHLEAHRAEFARPLEETLDFAKAAIIRKGPPEGPSAGAPYPAWEQYSIRCPWVSGHSGLARVWPWTRGDYWAPRPGRSIPSHLIEGRRRPTRDLCVWGYWESATSFLLHTLYPGRPAPREIHDPEIAPSELSKAIAFWRTHAIIVEKP